MATISEFINKVGFKVKEDDVKKVNDSISDIKSTATKLLGAIGIGFSLTSLNSLVEEFTRVKDQIRSSTSELGDQAEVQQKILDAASATRSEYADTAKMVSNLVKENSELFGTIDEAIAFNNAATMLFKTAGKTNDDIAGLMEAINKSFAKGKVDSETLSQLLEKAPEAVELLNKQLGTTSDQLEQLATDGKFTVEDLKAAFVDNADAIAASFGNVKMTVTDALTVIRNKWGLWLADTNEMLGLTNTIAKVTVRGFDMVLRVLTKVRNGVMWLSEKLGGTEKLLKLVAVAAGSIFLAMNGAKILGFLKGMGGLLGGIRLKTVAIAAAFILLFLLIEDFFNFMQGNDSLFGTMLEKAGIDTEKFRETVQGLWKQVKGIIPVIKEFAKGIGRQLLDAIKQVMPLLAEIGRVIIPFIVSALQRLVPFLIQIIQAILPVISRLLQQIIPFLVQIIEAILPVIVSLLEAILPLVMQIIETVLPIIIELINALLPLIIQIVETILPIILELIQAIVPILLQIIEAILPVVLELISAILPILQPIFDIIANLVSAVLPLVVELLSAILPILQPILAILGPIADILGVIIGAISKVVGWVADGLGWIVDLIFGGGADTSAAATVNGYADGTEYSDDTFVAGEEGPELITGQRGKKVFTAVQTGSIFNGIKNIVSGIAAAKGNFGEMINTAVEGMSAMSRAKIVSPATAATVSGDTISKSVVQNVEINNEFNGDKAIQQKAATAMDKSATDVTAELARGLAYAR